MDERPGQDNTSQPQWRVEWPPQTDQPRPYPVPLPPKKKRSKLKLGGIGCLGLIVLLAIAGIAGGTNSAAPTAVAQPADATQAGTTAPAAPAPPAGAAPVTTAAPAQSVVLKVSGSGTKTTKTFTTGDDWSIKYTYDCSNFGTEGNFQIYVYDNGDPSDTPVNELSKKGGDVTYEHGASGTHYLEMNSECDWTVTVTDGDTGQ